jgi:transposase-like protein
MEVSSNEGRPRRREYSQEFKTQILEQCRKPGASVGGVALSNGLHSNMVHRWIREERLRRLPARLVSGAVAQAFVALPLPPVPPSFNEAASAPIVQLQFQRGDLVATVQCPLSECAVLLREVLR